MNISSRDIISYNKKLEVKWETDKVYQKRLNENADINHKIEVDTVGVHSSICSLNIESTIEGRVDFDKLRVMMGSSGQFYNINVMKAGGCGVSSYIYGANANHSVATVANIKSTIGKMKQIGDESVSGIAIKADLDSFESAVVVKIPRTKDSEDDLIHETFVGLYGTNKLREYFPNFAIVFGGGKEAVPIIDSKTKEVTSAYNTSPDKVQYVLYESILPSKSFADYVQTCSAEDFHSSYLQACLSTDLAAHYIGFTHYDAHSGNWLNRKVNFKDNDYFCIRYFDPRTNKTRYVVSDHVATVIDYGRSTIKYKGRHMGTKETWLSVYGVVEGPWPLYDAYKLLMYSALALVDSKKGHINNSKVFREMELIFTFFNKEESLIDALKNQLDLHYILPRFDDIKHITVNDLIDHIETVCDIESVLVNEPTYPVLECDKCFTYNGAINEIAPSNIQPKSFFEFYDIALRIVDKSNSDKRYDTLVSSFDYAKSKEDFISLVDSDFVKLESHIDSIKDIPIVTPNNALSTMLKKGNVNIFADIYSHVFGAVSEYEAIELWLKIGNSMAILFSDVDLVDYIKVKREDLKTYDNAIAKNIEILGSNYRSIRSKAETTDWIKDYHKKFPWYRMVSGEIIPLETRFFKDRNELYKEVRLPSALVDLERKHNNIIPRKRRLNLKMTPTGEVESIDLDK